MRVDVADMQEKQDYRMTASLARGAACAIKPSHFSPAAGRAMIGLRRGLLSSLTLHLVEWPILCRLLDCRTMVCLGSAKVTPLSIRNVVPIDALDLDLARGQGVLTS